MRQCGEVDTVINVDRGIEKGHMTNMHAYINMLFHLRGSVENISKLLSFVFHFTAYAYTLFYFHIAYLR